MSCRYFGNIKPLIPLQVTKVDISASNITAGRTIQLDRTGGTENLKRREIFPNPATAELKLRVHAVALNRAESMYLLSTTKEF